MSKAQTANFKGRARANPLESIRHLYERHDAMFELNGGEIRQFVMEGLEKQTGDYKKRESAQKLKNALDATRANPQRSDLVFALALHLEQNGYYQDALQELMKIARLQQSTNENRFAIIRIYERLGGYDLEACYKNLFQNDINSSAFLLAVARYMATSNTVRLNEITLEEVKSRVDRALISHPDVVTLNLAKGFVCIAEDDIFNAQSYFLRATFLAELPKPVRSAGAADGSDDDEVDNLESWGLQYAKAFLLDPDPDKLSATVIFPPIDPSRLALVRGRLALSRGFVFSALEQYGRAVTRVNSGQPISTEVVFHGFRIFLHQGRFYAVPLSVRNFTIINGIVVRIPGSIEDHKTHIGDTVPPYWRKMIRPLWRFGRHQVAPALARVPMMHLIGRHVRSTVQRIYVKVRAAQGVLIETDVAILRDRIARMRAGNPADAHATARIEQQKAA